MLGVYLAAEQRIDDELGQLSGLLASQGFGRDESRRVGPYAAEQRQREAIARWWVFARQIRADQSVTTAELEKGQTLFAQVTAASR